MTVTYLKRTLLTVLIVGAVCVVVQQIWLRGRVVAKVSSGGLTATLRALPTHGIPGVSDGYVYETTVEYHETSKSMARFRWDSYGAQDHGIEIEEQDGVYVVSFLFNGGIGVTCTTSPDSGFNWERVKRR